MVDNRSIRIQRVTVILHCVGSDSTPSTTSYRRHLRHRLRHRLRCAENCKIRTMEKKLRENGWRSQCLEMEIKLISQISEKLKLHQLTVSAAALLDAADAASVLFKSLN